MTLRPIELRLGGEEIHLVSAREQERWGGFLNGIAMAMALAGCPRDEPGSAVSRVSAPQPGTLAFDLPSGVSISVDGEPRGVTPLPPIELSPSEHRIVLASACAEVPQTVVIQPGSETTIDRGAASALKFATLQVEAKTIRDKPLGVKLHVGEREILSDGGRFEIPACPQRIRVEPTGTLAYNLGSFIEDLDPKPGETIDRNLVLRPGPDVVRLHGGPFRQGPHPSDDFEWPRTPLEPKRVVVETFDMDKTEVTARQYMECLGEGMCEKDPGHVLYRDFCVFQLSDLTGNDATRFGRRMLEGKEDLPANCVNIVEAKSYCEWRGMRLPTPLEFDYAFRSGKSEYAFPWGTDESECRAFGWDVPACMKDVVFSAEPHQERYKGLLWYYSEALPACSFAEGKGVSEQGVCDLAGNRLEFAVFESDFDDEKRHYALGGEAAWTIGFVVQGGSLPGDGDIGFRCVREVPEGNQPQ